MTTNTNRPPQVGPSAFCELVRTLLDAPDPVHLCAVSAPGLGKSEMMRTVAEAHPLPVWYGLYSAISKLPEDLQGLPQIVGQETRWVRSRDLPPEGEPYIIPIDEIDKADRQVQNLIASLMSEGRIGEHRIHPDCRFLLTANTPEMRTGGSALPTHLLDRAVLIEVVTNTVDVLRHGTGKGWHPLVLAFLRYAQTTGEPYLSNFDPAAWVCASPRSWERVSRILQARRPGTPQTVLDAAITGAVGHTAAAAFLGFLRIAAELPTPQGIAADPLTAPLPSQPAARFAAASMLAAEATPQTLRAVLAYLSRLIDAGASEFAGFFALELEARKSPLLSHPDFTAWAVAHPSVLPS